MSRFFATASRGTEAVLADELTDLGITSVSAERGGVSFGSSLEDAYRACLWSRVASRVLLPLETIEADSAEALYDGIHAIDWTAHIGPERTLAVDVAGKDSPAGPGHFVTLKTKDAIVDRVREVEGARPDVDTRDPDLRVNVHVRGPRLTVSLDLGGRGLHRRGIGRAGAAAPLKENLAAAILRIAGWPERSGATPLFDPLCGSGTLLLEAAWIAADVAPGLLRRRVGAEGWRQHDASLWTRLRREAEERRRAGQARSARIAGSDASEETTGTVRANLSRASIRNVRVDRRDLRDARPPWGEPGLVVTNPPYGARLGEAGELGPFYELLGDVLKRRFGGWTAWVLTGNPALAKRIGLRPASRRPLHNGPIECRLLEIPIQASAGAGARGPGWRRPSAEGKAFAKRLGENLRRREAWARREGLTCYRIYDAEMPEYNLAVDRYGPAARVEEYERPDKIAADVAERHLRDALLVVPEVLGLDPADVVLRVRRKRVKGEQHERRDDRRRFLEVREGDLRFLVNLEDYLDTGLFLDDRLLRRWVRERSRDRSFLNLFAYTCTVSVAAARGGARSTTSVDLSKTYLDWGRRNFRLNNIAAAGQQFERADAVRWLAAGGDRRRHDLVFVAPPTYSKSKAMRGDFDVGRDAPDLLAACARILAPGGEILFATNARAFRLDSRRLPGLTACEITREITPPDFEHRPRVRAWTVRPVRPAPRR